MMLRFPSSTDSCPMAYPITFDASVTRDFARACGREWLETNGLGGWASSTICCAHTRRYHGMLVVATEPPVGRFVLLSKLEETLVLPHTRTELGCNIFAGAVHPEGHRLLTGFALDVFPTFTYATSSITLRKTIAMLHGEHTVVVLYELIRAPHTIKMELRPFFAGRDYHHLVRANQAVRQVARIEADIMHYQPYFGQPMVHLLTPGARYSPGPDWYYNYHYPREEERGLECTEDLFTPGAIHCSIDPGSSLGVLVSTEDPRGRDPESLLRQERERRAALEKSVTGSPLISRLAVAADQFLVRRRDGLHTIVAGYHWFTDWGRDTMISLPGICLIRDRFQEARSIFQAYAACIDEGMLPNRFGDSGGQAEYNTVDATLWFYVALYKYLLYTGDYGFVEGSLWNALQEIIAWHRHGTRYSIKVDPVDGLLRSGDERSQLTWMDAKVDDWVVTPRQGRAVEINALWYNVLRIMEHLARRFRDPELGQQFAQQADQVRTRFVKQFWNPEVGCLFDVVDGERIDASIRPNQIFALSLPFALLRGDQARQVFDTVDRHLFTPYGLRSLSPEDPAYHPRYTGGRYDRDGAYHQGTVWGWLMGPFITALVRVHGAEGRARGRDIIDGFTDHLAEAGLGTVSEIFDADHPYVPRGCIAQAWSVGELLRAYHEDIEGRLPDPPETSSDHEPGPQEK